MKYLGIDYGTKRVGIAVSDPLGTIAFPREILPNDSLLLEKLAQLIKEEKISALVIGKSLTLSGGENVLQRAIEHFVEKLEKKIGEDIPIYFQDERMSSHAVHMNFFSKEEKRSRKHISQKEKERKTRHIDAEAAAIILQRFLDQKTSRF